MERWITTDEVIGNKILSEINFIHLVDQGKITPFNKHTFHEIDLDLWKKNFSEIQERFIAFSRSDGFKISEMDFSHDKDDWESWNTIYTALVAWDTMGENDHELLIESFKSVFTYDQFLQISVGWNNNIVKKIIYESVFKENEVLNEVNKIYTKDTQDGEDVDIPQKTKSRNTLLKIIGAFIEIKYLHTTRSKTTYMNGDKPNATAIADKFYEELKAARFNDNGMKDRTFRKLIPEALDLIEVNKIEDQNTNEK